MKQDAKLNNNDKLNNNVELLDRSIIDSDVNNNKNIPLSGNEVSKAGLPHSYAPHNAIIDHKTNHFINASNNNLNRNFVNFMKTKNIIDQKYLQLYGFQSLPAFEPPTFASTAPRASPEDSDLENSSGFSSVNEFQQIKLQKNKKRTLKDNSNMPDLFINSKNRPKKSASYNAPTIKISYLSSNQSHIPPTNTKDSNHHHPSPSSLSPSASHLSLLVLPKNYKKQLSNNKKKQAPILERFYSCRSFDGLIDNEAFKQTNSHNKTNPDDTVKFFKSKTFSLKIKKSKDNQSFAQQCIAQKPQIKPSHHNSNTTHTKRNYFSRVSASLSSLQQKSLHRPLFFVPITPYSLTVPQKNSSENEKIKLSFSLKEELRKTSDRKQITNELLLTKPHYQQKQHQKHHHSHQNHKQHSQQTKQKHPKYQKLTTFGYILSNKNLKYASHSFIDSILSDQKLQKSLKKFKKTNRQHTLKPIFLTNPTDPPSQIYQSISTHSNFLSPSFHTKLNVQPFKQKYSRKESLTIKEIFQNNAAKRESLSKRHLKQAPLLDTVNFINNEGRSFTKIPFITTPTLPSHAGSLFSSFSTGVFVDLCIIKVIINRNNIIKKFMNF